MADGTLEAGSGAPGGLVPPPLGGRFRAALEWACDLHADQARKAGGTPYVGHLLGVCALVVGDGGSEDEAIAALLHDAVEDAGVTVSEVEERFGTQVAAIVHACSDATGSPKPPWRPRKEAFLARLPDTAPGTRRVIAADKLDNARALRRALAAEGGVAFRHFHGGRAGTLWYYRAVTDALAALGGGRLTDELQVEVRELEALAAD